jgi:hypothetical protein
MRFFHAGVGGIEYLVPICVGKNITALLCIIVPFGFSLVPQTNIMGLSFLILAGNFDDLKISV